ncbi:ribonuclease H-like domain-containing protein [Tanacetum coccineum]
MTIDHLGKFDGKADEGFFVGYSTNSKAFRVFNSRTRIVEENLHVKFSKDIPNIGGSGPNWLFDIDALTNSMNYKLIVAGKSSNRKYSTKAIQRVYPDADSIIMGGMKEKRMLKIQRNEVKVLDADDDEDVGAEADINNLDIHIPVSPILTTRIHKDHPFMATEDPDIKDLRNCLCMFLITRRAQEALSLSKQQAQPWKHHKPWLKDADGEDVDEHLYRSMIGSVMYLTSSRPDIMFTVWPIVSNDSPIDLVAYTDSDYAGKVEINKSSTETKIHIDNESTICIVKNPVFHSKTKHIKIGYHFIRDSNENKLIQMIKIYTRSECCKFAHKAHLNVEAVHIDCNIVECLTYEVLIKGRLIVLMYSGLYINDDWNGMKKLLRMEI